MPLGQPITLQDAGEEFYKHNMLNAALKSFTEALTRKQYANRVTVLDSRAATYTRLGKYGLALRDAKQMVVGDERDARGYLRAGKLFLLDGRPDKALAIYARGLKSVPNSHPQRHLVQAKHDELSAKMLASSKRVDPFSVLPYEVAMMVLGHLDFKHIVAILRVSKQWNRFLSSVPALWKHLDLSNSRKRVSWTAVRTYIHKSSATLTRATIANLATPSIPKSLELLSRCPDLEYLEVRTPFHVDDLYNLFQGSKKLKTLITSTEIAVPQEYIGRFLGTLPLVERIEVYNALPSLRKKVHYPPVLPRLRSITIHSSSNWRNGVDAPPISVPWLSEARQILAPNLEELRLVLDTPKVQLYPLCVGESVHPRLRRLDLDGVQLFCFQVPPRLEYFRYCNEVTPNIPGRDDGVDYLIRAPSVSTIILSNVPRADVFIKRLYCTETEIAARVIHLDDCLDVSGPSMQRLAEQSDKLNPVTDLSLSNASDVNDSNVSIITAKMADLMSVNLSHTEISGCTIKHLADSGRKIARICVKGCENVSSDAVAYGRAKGIEIIT